MAKPTVEELEALMRSDDATRAHILPDGSVVVGAKTTIFFDHAGPAVRYIGGVLVIEDLNPAVMTMWRMSRREMARMAWRCLLAAVRP